MKNLTVLIIDDNAYSSIAVHKDEFIKSVLDAISSNSNDRQEIKIGEMRKAMSVRKIDNRDIPKLYITHTSNLVEFGYNNDLDDIEYRKGLVQLAQNILKQEEQIIKNLENKTRQN